MQEMRVWSLGGEDPLEEGMATHSGILAWEIPWTEEPGGLQSIRSQSWTHWAHAVLGVNGIMSKKMNICCCCSVPQLCLTLCNPTDCSTPGFPVLQHLPEFAETHVHWVGDAIQLFHSVSLYIIYIYKNIQLPFYTENPMNSMKRQQQQQKNNPCIL